MDTGDFLQEVEEGGDEPGLAEELEVLLVLNFHYFEDVPAVDFESEVVSVLNSGHPFEV